MGVSAAMVQIETQGILPLNDAVAPLPAEDPATAGQERVGPKSGRMFPSCFN